MIPTQTWVNQLSVAILTISFLINIDQYNCLSCWHCIAENCAEDPSDNYKASKKQCSEGQMCQKVYFQMYSKIEGRGYESTVRGCSSNCKLRDDFTNCSTLLKESRGCIQRSCCSDSDLCNSANQFVTFGKFLPVFLWCLIFTFVIVVLS